MKIKEKIKNLEWIIENRKEIEEVLKEFKKNKNKNSGEVGYSLAGVPEFQRAYVKELLEKEK